MLKFSLIVTKFILVNLGFEKNVLSLPFQTNYTLLPSVGLYGSTEFLEVIDNAWIWVFGSLKNCRTIKLKEIGLIWSFKK